MKTLSNNFFKPVSKEELKNLTSIVTENLYQGPDHKKAFTSADLWNIQRSKRSILNRRYLDY